MTTAPSPRYDCPRARLRRHHLVEVDAHARLYRCLRCGKRVTLGGGYVVLHLSPAGMAYARAAAREQKLERNMVSFVDAIAAGGGREEQGSHRPCCV